MTRTHPLPTVGLVWIIPLLMLAMAAFASGMAYGQPEPAYSPSTVKNGWLNSATIYHPDNYDYVARPYAMLLRGISPLKPNFYHNPSLTIYLNMVMSWVSGATQLYHRLIDPHQPPPALLDCESGNPPHPVCLRPIAPFVLYVVGRVISALAGTLAVAVVYRAGRSLSGSRAGLLAAAIVASSPLVVQHAHYAMPAMPTLLCSSGALLGALVLLQQRRSGRHMYAAAGLMVGLATGARYNAAPVIVPVLLAMGVNWWRQRNGRALIIGLAAMPVGFLIVVPGAIFEIRVFIEDLRFILNWYNVSGGGPGWTAAGPLQALGQYGRYLVLIVFGPLTAGLAVIGAARLIRRQRRDLVAFWSGIALVLFIIVYALGILTSKRINANLLFPLLPVIALLSAHGATELTRRWRPERWTLVTIGVATLAWPAILSLMVIGLIRDPDNRLQAQAWVFAHVPVGTPIHLLGSYNVPLDPQVYTVTQTFGAGASLDDPLWDSPLIIYSDAYPHSVLRDPSLTQDVAVLTNIQVVADRLERDWIKLAMYERRAWPGQDWPPDDMSFWHQMGIAIYCNPRSCPVLIP